MHADYRTLLVRYLFPQRRAALLMSALLFTSITFQAIGPQFLRRLIDAIRADPSLSYLTTNAAFFLLIVVVGPRGMRLSGGQVQRTAAARALVGAPTLLVVADLSSALDVATEAALWQRLRAREATTVLAVSTRRITFHQADQIIVLKDGAIEAVGPLASLLESSQEMRHLYNMTA